MAIRMLFIAVLVCGLTGSTEGYSQSKSAAKSSSKTSSAAKSKVTTKHRRLPTYFGQLKLKDDQREEVYKVRADFGPKLEELEKQLEKMKVDMMKKMEAALTTTQKRELTKLRNGTSSSSNAKASSKSSSRKTESVKSGSTKSQSSTKKAGSTKAGSSKSSSSSKSSGSKSSGSKKSATDDKK